ncbi:hypothetical protein KPATCC21470_0657 [Kitasatospora purpeofusca]
MTVRRTPARAVRPAAPSIGATGGAAVGPPCETLDGGPTHQGGPMSSKRRRKKKARRKGANHGKRPQC